MKITRHCTSKYFFLNAKGKVRFYVDLKIISTFHVKHLREKRVVAELLSSTH